MAILNLELFVCQLCSGAHLFAEYLLPSKTEQNQSDKVLEWGWDLPSLTLEKVLILTAPGRPPFKGSGRKNEFAARAGGSLNNYIPSGACGEFG